MEATGKFAPFRTWRASSGGRPCWIAKCRTLRFVGRIVCLFVLGAAQQVMG
jgi:hypothetical protein